MGANTTMLEAALDHPDELCPVCGFYADHKPDVHDVRPTPEKE